MRTYNKSSKKQERYKRSYRKKIKKSKKKTRKSVKRIKRSYLRNSKKKLKGNKQKGGAGASGDRNLKKIMALTEIPIETLNYIFIQMKSNKQVFDKNLKVINTLLNINPEQQGEVMELIKGIPDEQYRVLITSVITDNPLPQGGVEASAESTPGGMPSVDEIYTKLSYLDGLIKSSSGKNEMIPGLFDELNSIIQMMKQYKYEPTVISSMESKMKDLTDTFTQDLMADFDDAGGAVSPELCIQCHTREKYKGSQFCGNTCKGNYLDSNLQCLTCKTTQPMGKLSKSHGKTKYNIESLFCEQCREKKKDEKWKKSVNANGKFYGQPAPNVLDAKGWSRNVDITREVRYALDQYHEWMKS